MDQHLGFSKTAGSDNEAVDAMGASGNTSTMDEADEFSFSLSSSRPKPVTTIEQIAITAKEVSDHCNHLMIELFFYRCQFFSNHTPEV